MLLLNQLVVGQALAPETRAEVVATYMYTFVGVIMPDYCHKRWAWYSLFRPPRDLIVICRVMAILDGLCHSLSENPPSLPSWIFVSPTSIPPILGAINYWIDMAKTTRTEKAIELHRVPDVTTSTLPPGMPGPMFPNPGNMGAYSEKLLREIASAGLESMTGEQLVRGGMIPPYLTPSQAEQYLERHKPRIVEIMLDKLKAGLPTPDTDVEAKWYSITKTHPIPKALEGRHTVLKQLAGAVRRGKDVTKTLITKVALPPKCSVSECSLTLDRHNRRSKRHGSPTLRFMYVFNPPVHPPFVNKSPV